MSSAVIRILRCDGRACPKIITTGEHVSAADLRVIAARNGWQIRWERDTPTSPRARVDRCPEHAEHVCPHCRVERADWEGEGMHLPVCPNCGSTAAPIPANPGPSVDQAAATISEGATNPEMGA